MKNPPSVLACDEALGQVPMFLVLPADAHTFGGAAGFSAACKNEQEELQIPLKGGYLQTNKQANKKLVF